MNHLLYQKFRLQKQSKHEGCTWIRSETAICIQPLPEASLCLAAACLSTSYSCNTLITPSNAVVIYIICKVGMGHLVVPSVRLSVRLNLAVSCKECFSSCRGCYNSPAASTVTLQLVLELLCQLLTLHLLWKLSLRGLRVEGLHVMLRRGGVVFVFQLRQPALTD